MTLPEMTSLLPKVNLKIFYSESSNGVDTESTSLEWMPALCNRGKLLPFPNPMRTSWLHLKIMSTGMVVSMTSLLKVSSLNICLRRSSQIDNQTFWQADSTISATDSGNTASQFESAQRDIIAAYAHRLFQSPLKPTHQMETMDKIMTVFDPKHFGNGQTVIIREQAT